jgi:hypothetical protein
MSVERESSADFFGEISTAVVTGGKFKVHATPFSIARFIFDSNVRHGNLSSNDLETVPLGNDVFAIDGIAVFAYLSDIAVEMLLQFVVENDAKGSASLTFDLCSSFLIQPVEVGIVMGFAWVERAVIKCMPFSSVLRVGEKAMVVLGKCEHLARTGFLVRNRFEFNRALTNEDFQVGFHTIVVTAIGKVR